MHLRGPNISTEGNYPETGTLLLAHPSMQDPNFYRTVVFLAAHDSEDGSLGLVMNRAMNKTLGESDPALSNSLMADVPLYDGGPVARDKLILAAWRWVQEEGTFQLYFGIDNIRAEQLLVDSSFQVRGFMGHAGWTEGQLDVELEQDAWLLSRSLPELINGEGEEVWRSILLHENPAMRLFLDAPEDPSLN